MARPDAVPDLIVLIGPKGAGKSAMGRALAAEIGGAFVDVEAISKAELARSGGVIDERYAARAFAAIRAELRRLKTPGRPLIMETTGASDAAPAFLAGLRADHRPLLVRIDAGQATCLARIRARDPSGQVAVPEEMIAAMHRRTEALDLGYDIRLRNDEADDLAGVVAGLAGQINSRLGRPA